MIFVVCTFLNPENMMPMSNMEKNFTSQDEFIKWYNLAKADPCVVLNIMKYNPIDKPSTKDVYDALLLRVNRERPV